MHTEDHSAAFRSCYSGYRHKKELIFLVTSLLTTSPCLMRTDPRSWSLWGQQGKGELGASSRQVPSWPHTAQFTRAMSTPVSFSTVAGSLVMMSSTSPASLEAPTSEPPLDTMVTFWAADRGLLISSAICRESKGTNERSDVAGNGKKAI